MKKLLFILLTVSFSVYAQNENQKKKELILSNHIKEKITYQYNEHADSVQTGIDIYDIRGNHIQDLRLEGDTVVFKYIIEYNEKDLMTKQTGYEENGDISSVLLYEYDENGNRISYRQLDDTGGILGHQKRKYNALNQNTELYNLDKKSNEFYLSYKFFYNDNGLYQSTETYNSDGKLISTTEYEYDNGNLVKLIRRLNGRKYKTSYEYDSQGRIIKKKYHRKRNVILNGKKIVLNQWEEKFEYDDENNLILKISSGNGLNFQIEKYFYKKHS
ncbi:MAG TPA: hypothetical protein VFM70_05650 [Salinimicrobium sp.]|nr:hypothetical protein [Salinimicrobium sp.]